MERWGDGAVSHRAISISPFPHFHFPISPFPFPHFPISPFPHFPISPSSHLPMDDLVFLIDVDETLLNNDAVIDDLKRRLVADIGEEGKQRYWVLFEQL